MTEAERIETLRVMRRNFAVFAVEPAELVDRWSLTPKEARSMAASARSMVERLDAALRRAEGAEGEADK